MRIHFKMNPPLSFNSHLMSSMSVAVRVVILSINSINRSVTAMMADDTGDDDDIPRDDTSDELGLESLSLLSSPPTLSLFPMSLFDG